MGYDTIHTIGTFSFLLHLLHIVIDVRSDLVDLNILHIQYDHSEYSAGAKHDHLYQVYIRLENIQSDYAEAGNMTVNNLPVYPKHYCIMLLCSDILYSSSMHEIFCTLRRNGAESHS